MYLPSRSDYRALGKTFSLLAWILLVAWWFYPLIIVLAFFYHCIRAIEWVVLWIIEEVKNDRDC